MALTEDEVALISRMNPAARDTKLGEVIETIEDATLLIPDLEASVEAVEGSISALQGSVSANTHLISTNASDISDNLLAIEAVTSTANSARSDLNDVMNESISIHSTGDPSLSELTVAQMGLNTTAGTLFVNSGTPGLKELAMKTDIPDVTETIVASANPVAATDMEIGQFWINDQNNTVYVRTNAITVLKLTTTNFLP